MTLYINNIDEKHKINSFYKSISRRHSEVKHNKGVFTMLLTGLIKRGWGQVRMWREIARERSELRRLSESLAKDIGISRADAEREADRPFWDYERPAERCMKNETSPRSRDHAAPSKRCQHA